MRGPLKLDVGPFYVPDLILQSEILFSKVNPGLDAWHWMPEDAEVLGTYKRSFSLTQNSNVAGVWGGLINEKSGGSPFLQLSLGSKDDLGRPCKESYHCLCVHKFYGLELSYRLDQPSQQPRCVRQNYFALTYCFKRKEVQLLRCKDHGVGM